MARHKALTNKHANAQGKAYAGLAAHFSLKNNSGDVIIIAKDVEALHAAAAMIDAKLDVSMAAPVLVFADRDAPTVIEGVQP